MIISFNKLYDEQMNSTFEKDLYRYYGNCKSKVYSLKWPLEVKYLFYLRILQANPCFILRLYCKYRLKTLSVQMQIQISPTTEIGEGFYIGHTGRVIINPNAKLGKNINIATGVTIGQENRGNRLGCPTIHDKCWIGTNSVIVGNITIGEDCLIAPLSFVNFDVPSHSIVIGNPARIIPKENATVGYINNLI